MLGHWLIKEIRHFIRKYDAGLKVGSDKTSFPLRHDFPASDPGGLFNFKSKKEKQNSRNGWSDFAQTATISAKERY
jgi:hypothetical protein